MQDKFLKYSPVEGTPYMAVSAYTADGFRQGHDLPWKFDPWTGGRRSEVAVFADPYGVTLEQGHFPEVASALSGIDATLAERGNRYGVFSEHARITQNIKRAMADSPNWAKLSDDKKETLEMLAHKIGRILNGDPEYHDSWHDIIGYTKLVADTLEH